MRVLSQSLIGDIVGRKTKAVDFDQDVVHRKSLRREWMLVEDKLITVQT